MKYSMRVLAVAALATLSVSLSACSGSTSAKSEVVGPPAKSSTAKPAVTAEVPGPAPKIDEKRAMQYVKDIVGFGRRAPGSPGMKKQQDYLRTRFKEDQLEEDVFTADTPAGKFELRNFIAKFPGSTDEVVVIASHYDTNYPLKNFVGANDSGSSTGLLLEVADQLRGRKLIGPAIWLVFFDGEEAFVKWSAKDSLYGSTHLAAKWKQDGTSKKIKAFILTDMIGDADLNIEHDTYSTPWLSDMVLKSATNLGHQMYFFNRSEGIEDDHLPFKRIGVPVVDLIDLDYGYDNVFHHSSEDTLDKLSPRSLKIVGDTIMETLRLLGSH